MSKLATKLAALAVFGAAFAVAQTGAEARGGGHGGHGGHGHHGGGSWGQAAAGPNHAFALEAAKCTIGLRRVFDPVSGGYVVQRVRICPSY